MGAGSESKAFFQTKTELFGQWETKHLMGVALGLLVALLDIDAAYLSIGIIKAIQLDYSEAHKNLLQAIRKAPQHSGYGFKQTVSIFHKQFQDISVLCSLFFVFLEALSLTLRGLGAFLEQLLLVSVIYLITLHLSCNHFHTQLSRCSQILYSQ